MNTSFTQPATAQVAQRCATEPRPLMPVYAVTWRLDLHDDQVMLLVEEGTLLWAFDIRLPGANRRSIRVLTESVEDLVYSRHRPLEDEESEWQRVAGLIFPNKPTIVVCELARALNVSRGYALLLVRAGYFRRTAGSQIRRGPNGSPHFVTASVAAWLRKRRIF